MYWIGWKTGSGKSTLFDILMGLLKPSKGSIYIDGNKIDLENNRAWQKNIAHVPQNIYLSDSSIKENIAFGISQEEINQELIIQAAKMSKIDEYINNLLDKYDTKVGERGIKLSGGEKQRVAIARAFYKKSNIIILDEATSALDLQTESQIMNIIRKLGKNTTVFMISHRISSLENCDRIIKLEKGKITEINQ